MKESTYAGSELMAVAQFAQARVMTMDCEGGAPQENSAQNCRHVLEGPWLHGIALHPARLFGSIGAMKAAERLYSASTSEDETVSRLAEELARRIEDDIASRDLPTG